MLPKLVRTTVAPDLSTVAFSGAKAAESDTNGAPTCTETRAGSLPVRAAIGTTGDGIS